MKTTTLMWAVAGMITLAACEKTPVSSGHYADGYCLNEGCECESGYTGDDCTIEMTPTVVRIDHITVHGLPETNHGESWDPVNGTPDVYFLVKDRYNEVYVMEEVLTDVEPGQTIQYRDLNIQLEDAKATYDVRFLDKDAEDKASEIMSEVQLPAYIKEGGFPAHVQLTDGETVIEFDLSYEF